jgi:hypothetical protein
MPEFRAIRDNLYKDPNGYRMYFKMGDIVPDHIIITEDRVYDEEKRPMGCFAPLVAGKKIVTKRRRAELGVDPEREKAKKRVAADLKQQTRHELAATDADALAPKDNDGPIDFMSAFPEDFSKNQKPHIASELERQFGMKTRYVNKTVDTLLEMGRNLQQERNKDNEE